VSQPRPTDLPAVRIEVENEWAWCGARRLELTPRVFAVLRHLVEHADRLVTKDDLLAAVWRGVAVSDAALASCIRDLRRRSAIPRSRRATSGRCTGGGSGSSGQSSHPARPRPYAVTPASR
jgi:DNA-binding response OmpR family regulator